ncbi:hypothetical protein [Mesorhizobium sp.]|uniref:hypothetical protein n=1 Tax=Mesorhizobium sp. TaxID=1871066 RepID=UPI002579B113|nr:hypothetical protein [Mesorhizobium sp.]
MAPLLCYCSPSRSFFKVNATSHSTAFWVGLFAFPPLCRDIPNQLLLFRIGIFWFSAFAIIAAIIYAAGDRAQPALPVDNLHVDRATPAVTIERTT